MRYMLAALMVSLAYLVLPTGEARAQGQCPDNFSAYANSDETVDCVCIPEATQRGSVWGTDIYTADSSVCRAALHAGIIGRRGGPVTLTAKPGQPRYVGVTRNGVVSSNYGPYDSSFVFGEPRAERPGSAPAEANQLCPENFASFANAGEVVYCVCDEAATRTGPVWGSDVYTSDSSVCRAAVHAGLIGRRGGPVAVVPRPGRQRYVGETRNGITSADYGPYESSFAFQGRAR